MDFQPSDVGDAVIFGAMPMLLAVLNLLLAGANMVWTWIQKNQTAAADQVKKLENDLILLTARVQQLEGDYKHLPTKDDINGLRVQLEGVAAQQRAAQNEMTNVNRVVNRIDDYLREKA